MTHCININTPEYKALKEQAQKINMGQRDLKGIIATWQYYTGKDTFPSFQDVVNITNSKISIAGKTLVREKPTIPFQMKKEHKDLLEKALESVMAKGMSENLMNISTILHSEANKDNGKDFSKESLQNFKDLLYTVADLSEHKHLFQGKIAPIQKDLPSIMNAYYDRVSHENPQYNELLSRLLLLETATKQGTQLSQYLKTRTQYDQQQKSLTSFKSVEALFKNASNITVPLLVERIIDKYSKDKELVALATELHTLYDSLKQNRKKKELLIKREEADFLDQNKTTEKFNVRTGILKVSNIGTNPLNMIHHLADAIFRNKHITTKQRGNASELLRKTSELMNKTLPEGMDDGLTHKKEYLQNNPNSKLYNTVQVTPYTAAFQRLSTQYNIVDLKDLSTTLAQEFSELVTWYHEQNSTMTREEVISWLTPVRIFQEVKEQFEADLQDYRDEGLEIYAANMQRFLANFDDFAFMANAKIKFMEGLRFTPQDTNTYSYDQHAEDDMGVSETDDISNFIEEIVLEGWMRNFKHTSVGSSMTNKVKRLLSSINEMDNSKQPVANSIGYGRKLNLDLIKVDILEHTQGTDSLNTFLHALSVRAIERPWLNSVIEAIEEDNELASQFYTVMRKDFMKHSIVKVVKKEDGTLGYETPVINESDDVYLWIGNWRSHLENRTVFDKRYSVYNSDGSLNTVNAENNLTILRELSKEWKNIVRTGELKDRIDFIEENVALIKQQLNAIGIGLSTVEVNRLLQDAVIDIEKLKEDFNINRTNFNLDTILDRLIKQNSWVTKNNTKENTSISLINQNQSNYRTIASLVTRTLEDIAEGSVHEGGKTYYSYLQPSYMTTLINKLKNARGDITAFNDFIFEEYGQYVGTLYNPETNTYNISWLNNLVERGGQYRELLEHKTVLNYNKTDYDSLGDVAYQTMLLVEYFSPSVNATGTENAKAWYHIPIQGESPSAEFIQFERTIMNFRENISKKLLDVFTYEYERIKLVRLRKKGIANGTIQAIDNLDDRGEVFHFLPMLNPHIKQIDALVKKGTIEALNFVQEKIQEGLEEGAERSIARLKEQGLLETNDKGKFIYLDSLKINQDNFQEKLTEYYFNSYFASTNIAQLSSTDLAYNKNTEDFQKRNKQTHVPGDQLNTEAMYKGERLGKDYSTDVTLADVLEGSSDDFIANLKEALKTNPTLTKVERDTIVEKYTRGKDTKGNDITDGQGFRSLESARSVIAMHKGWNDRLEESYQRLKKGDWSFEDYNIMHQTFKLFLYTQNKTDSKVFIDPNDPSKGTYTIKVPVQQKNSEAILIPSMIKQFKSARLKGVLDAMEQGKIDVIAFKSNKKMGAHGVIHLNPNWSASQITEHILAYKEDNQFFRKFSYSDYKVLSTTGENLQNTTSLVGTQIRKLIKGDHAKDALFTIEGKKNLTKDEWLKLYDYVVIEGLLESFQNVLGEFDNPQTLQALLESEIESSDRHSRDFLQALQLDGNGEFVLPLYEPGQSTKIQQLINSVWKNRITKQRIKGGTAVHLSSFGVSEQLDIEYHEVNGQKAIKYIEAYMPYWEDFEALGMPEKLEKYIDESGILDAQAMLKDGVISDKILEAIGYRIPTEDKYSMLPLKIKGFLPRNMGGNIILPREITTIMGIDFDIDTMYLMLNEVEYNEKDGIFEIVDYDINEDPKNMTQAQRNNLYIDLVRAVLTNPDTVSKQVNPGGFDGPKETSRRLNLLSANTKLTWEQLQEMSLKELDKLTSQQEANILEFTTQVQYHKQNMTAATLIGMIANHSVNHAVRQETLIEVVTQIVKTTDKDTGATLLIPFPRVSLNGKQYTKLHEQIAPDGSAYISKRYASYLAASVDAVKDAVLSFLNLNTFTTDTAMLLTGLGYSFDEVGLFLRQPIIEEVVALYERKADSGMSQKGAIEEVLNQYRDFLANEFNLPLYSNRWELSQNNFYTQDMADMIKANSVIKGENRKSLEEIQAFKQKNKASLSRYYKYQYQVLLNFQRMAEVAQELSDFISATRADTDKGAAGPTIAHTEDKRDKIIKNQKNSEKKELLLSGTNLISIESGLELERLRDKEFARNYLRNSRLPMMQGFASLGISGTELILKEYFPHYSPHFRSIFETLTENSPTGRISPELRNKVYNEYFTYYLSQNEYFQRDAVIGENGKIEQQSMLDFVMKFPVVVEKFIEDHPELSRMILLKNIMIRPLNPQIPFSTIYFRQNGKLSMEARDEIKMEWESLLSNPDYFQFAIDLFKYDFYRNGLNFGQGSMAHLAPTAVKLAVPEYAETLKHLLESVSSKRSSDNTMGWYKEHSKGVEVSSWAQEKTFKQDSIFILDNGAEEVEIDVAGKSIQEVYDDILENIYNGTYGILHEQISDDSLSQEAVEEILYQEVYKSLWEAWVVQNSNEFTNLIYQNTGSNFTDKNLTNNISPARALSEIANSEFSGEAIVRLREDRVIFIDQLYRNNLHDRRLVPLKEIESAYFVRESEGESTLLDQIVLEAIDFPNNNDDLPTFVGKHELKNGTFIAVNLEGGTEYYKVEILYDKLELPSEVTFDRVAIGNMFTPLGLKGNLKEYNFNEVFMDTKLTQELYDKAQEHLDQEAESIPITTPQAAYEAEYEANFIAETQESTPADMMQLYQESINHLAEGFLTNYEASAEMENDIVNQMEVQENVRKLMEEVGEDNIRKQEEQC